ncbi:hypothetical protein C8J57DRAFT_1522739 [Mycena rebaudengoi]|nr:hypothetical protein C8J57DRAFT_1522739 [Mycena rebaudengoi]
MALCVPKTPTHVTDFQGHVLDSIGNGNGIANNRVVTGFPRNVPNSANQLWLFSHVPSPGNNTVTITVGNSAIPFLSSVATGMVRLTQAATVTTPVNFTVECLGTNTARIRNCAVPIGADKLALTAGPSEQPGKVTWEDFTGGPQQTWSFLD